MQQLGCAQLSVPLGTHLDKGLERGFWSADVLVQGHLVGYLGDAGFLSARGIIVACIRGMV